MQYFYPTDYPENDCYNLLTCFIITADRFPKSGSGIGEYLNRSYSIRDDNSVGIKYSRIVFDNLAYLLIMVFMNGVFTGIVVDTFGEIRDREKELKDDEQRSWFIWGKTRKELEKDRNYQRFNKHVMHKLNIKTKINSNNLHMNALYISFSKMIKLSSSQTTQNLDCHNEGASKVINIVILNFLLTSGVTKLTAKAERQHYLKCKHNNKAN